MVLVPTDDPEIHKKLFPGAFIYSRWFIFRAVMEVMSETAHQADRTKLHHKLAESMRQVGEKQFRPRKKGKPPESNPNPPAASQSKDRAGSA
jgi:hypothetical protein